MESRPFKDILQGLRQQYVWRLTLRYLAPGLLCGAAVALVWSLVASASGINGVWNSAWLKAILVIAGSLVGISFVRAAVPSLYGLAKRLDDQLGLSDRLSTAYALQERSADDPMVAIVVEDTHERLRSANLKQALPSPHFGALAGGLVLFLASVGLSTGRVVVEEKPKIEEETRFELKRQVKKLDDLMVLQFEELTEEEKEHFQRIRAMITALQLEDNRISRKEMLARFSREIEGLEDLDERSEALKSMLEQLKEAKDAVAGQMLVRRQIEEIEKQHTELAVTDAQTGEKLKAEEIEVMAVQEERRRQQEAMAKDIKDVADKEAKREDVKEWVVTEEPEAGVPGEGGAETTPTKKARVIASYEDLVKAAEKKDIRQMIFKAAMDPSRETPEYREVFANYERAFKSLLLQGSLSIGTRQYLRRYFKAISPIIKAETKEQEKKEEKAEDEEEGA
jgi:hypothetical protein